jgi:hypothetical protein
MAKCRSVVGGRVTVRTELESGRVLVLQPTGSKISKRKR